MTKNLLSPLTNQIVTIKAHQPTNHQPIKVFLLLMTFLQDEEAPECTNVRRFIQSHNKCSEDSSIVLKKILAGLQNVVFFQSFT